MRNHNAGRIYQANNYDPNSPANLQPGWQTVDPQGVPYNTLAASTPEGALANSFATDYRTHNSWRAPATPAEMHQARTAGEAPRTPLETEGRAQRRADNERFQSTFPEHVTHGTRTPRRHGEATGRALVGVPTAAQEAAARAEGENLRPGGSYGYTREGFRDLSVYAQDHHATQAEGLRTRAAALRQRGAEGRAAADAVHAVRGEYQTVGATETGPAPHDTSRTPINTVNPARAGERYQTQRETEAAALEAEAAAAQAEADFHARVATMIGGSETQLLGERREANQRAVEAARARREREADAAADLLFNGGRREEMVRQTDGSMSRQWVDHPSAHDRISQNRRFGTLASGRTAAADGYVADVRGMLDEGFTLAQATFLADENLNSRRDYIGAETAKIKADADRDLTHHQTRRNKLERDALTGDADAQAALRLSNEKTPGLALTDARAEDLAGQRWDRRMQGMRRIVRNNNLIDREDYDIYRQNHTRRDQRFDTTQTSPNASQPIMFTEALPVAELQRRSVRGQQLEDQRRSDGYLDEAYRENAARNAAARANRPLTPAEQRQRDIDQVDNALGDILRNMSPEDRDAYDAMVQENQMLSNRLAIAMARRSTGHLRGRVQVYGDRLSRREVEDLRDEVIASREGLMNQYQGLFMDYMADNPGTLSLDQVRTWRRNEQTVWAVGMSLRKRDVKVGDSNQAAGPRRQEFAQDWANLGNSIPNGWRKMGRLIRNPFRTVGRIRGIAKDLPAARDHSTGGERIADIQHNAVERVLTNRAENDASSGELIAPIYSQAEASRARNNRRIRAVGTLAAGVAAAGLGVAAGFELFGRNGEENAAAAWNPAPGAEGTLGNAGLNPADGATAGLSPAGTEGFGAAIADGLRQGVEQGAEIHYNVPNGGGLDLMLMQQYGLSPNDAQHAAEAMVNNGLAFSIPNVEGMPLPGTPDVGFTQPGDIVIPQAVNNFITGGSWR